MAERRAGQARSGPHPTKGGGCCAVVGAVARPASLAVAREQEPLVVGHVPLVGAAALRSLRGHSRATLVETLAEVLDRFPLNREQRNGFVV
jgi:hypothetical protein